MNTNNIGIEVDGDVIFITVAKYKLFLSYGKIGMDAYLLYSHLMFTARLQKTQSVKAKDIYLRQGLHWGTDRLRKAKQLLIELELINPIQRRAVDGQFDESYIEVKTRRTPFEIEPATLETGALETGSRETTNKCLNEEVKCFNEEVKAPKKFIKPSTDQIQEYIQERGITSFTAQDFYDKNESIGWLVGKNKTPMKDWKACIRTWESNNKKRQPKPQYKKFDKGPVY